MIHIYVPLEPKGKDRDGAYEKCNAHDIIDGFHLVQIVTVKVEVPRTGPQALNNLGHDLDDVAIFATSSPLACGVGQIAPSLVDTTTLVLILDSTWGDLCTAKLPRAMERNRPDHVLAFVRGWANDVHERNLRGYLQTKYSVPLKVIHIDNED